MDCTVIGIDPGSRITGWGIVQEISGVLRFVDAGAIHTVRTSTKGSQTPFSQRLAIIYHELAHIIAKHSPQEAAIEQVFTAKNPATALKLGQARGAAVVACASCGLSVADYEPTLIKNTLVGTGRAHKDQVAFMVAQLLNMKGAQWEIDTSDALAVAICHLTMRRFARLTRI